MQHQQPFTYYTIGRVRNGQVHLAPGDIHHLPPDFEGKEVLLSMSSTEDLKCVIFTHFSPGQDWLPTEKKKRELEERWRDRFQAYWQCSSVVRHVFVFISEGYQALLSVRRREAPFIGLSLDRTLLKIATDAAKKAGCPKGFIEPIGFDRLVDVLSRLQQRAKESKQQIGLLLLGSGEYMRYDSPKMVDAILRIAGRRTGSPVLRIDDDVCPNEQSLKRLLDIYKRMPDRDREAVFCFSGGYGRWTYENDAERESALLNNYAVRTHHLAERRLSPGGGWELPPDACRKFLEGLSEIGAPQGFAPDNSGGDRQDAQVISGGGFCLSYGAIKKLPPFANLDNPITWIDDHLKRLLHEALGDLGRNARVSRVVGATFQQNRHPKGIKDDHMRPERVQPYLATLARGCIFAALIGDRKQLGPYSESIDDYLKSKPFSATIFATGRNPDGSREPQRPLTDLGMEMLNIGNQRIEKVAAHWGQELSGEKLQTRDGRTLILREDFVRQFLQPAELGDQLVTNAVQGRRAGEEGCRVYEVLEDAEQYLDLLRAWRSFVHVLEEITDGTDWLFSRF